jgi:Leucine-rich repeat (LRR) protein
MAIRQIKKIKVKTMPRDQAYYEAKKKIEEVLKLGALELDLSNPPYKDPKPPQLCELPDSLWQLTQLQKLNLSSNQLTALPESLGQLIQLQELNFSGNQLTTLPESLGQLTQLQDLDLSSNKMIALPESLENLINLKKT